MASLGTPDHKPAGSPGSSASPAFTFGSKSKTSFNFSSPTTIDQESPSSAAVPLPPFNLSPFTKSPMPARHQCACSHGHHHHHHHGGSERSAEAVAASGKETGLGDDLEQELLSTLTEEEIQTLIGVLQRAGVEGPDAEGGLGAAEELAREQLEVLREGPVDWLKRPVRMQEDDDDEDDEGLKLGPADEDGETNSLGGFELEGGAEEEGVGANAETFDDPFGDDADLDKVIANLTSLRFHGLTPGGPGLDPATVAKQQQQGAAENVSRAAVVRESAEQGETCESSEEVESWLAKSEEGAEGGARGMESETRAGEAMKES